MSDPYRTVVDFDLQALMALIQVVERGSFTAAAAELGVTQPAVSIAIKKLEERVGAALLVRTRKRAVPTAQGQALARQAQLALDALADGVSQVADARDVARGRVGLGCHESLAAYALPGFMARFLRTYPEVELSLWNGTSREVERQVIDGGVDLGLVVNPSQHPDTVVQVLFEDTVELICAGAVVGKSRPATLLGRLPLLYVPVLAQSQHLLAALRERGKPPGRLLPCSSLELVKSLVLDRVGIGILPRRVARHGTPRGKLTSLSPPLPSYSDSIALVRRYDVPETAAVRAVLSELRAHGHTLAGSGRTRKPAL